MNNFTFRNPTKIHFGKGQIAKIAEEIPSDARVLITYGGGSIKKNGVLDQVHAALKDITFFEFSGIEPNPHFETLIQAVALAKEQQITHILAVGGGSVVDGSKFIAAATYYEGDPLEMLYTRAAGVKKAIPLGCVLTLPATGSEMNGNFVVTRAETKDKLGMFSDLVRPVYSILDPETTYSLPARQTGNGVVDAFVHIIEQYMTYPVNAKVQDRYAESLLTILMEDGPTALHDPTNYDARANIMWAATQALNGTLSLGVPGDWSNHAIGHQITALYGLDHAQTLAIAVPAVWTYKREQKKAKLLQYAERVLGLTNGDEESRVNATIEKTRNFFETMGVPTTFAAYGLNESAIPAIIEKLITHKRLALGEHADITPTDVEKILQLAL